MKANLKTLLLLQISTTLVNTVFAAPDTTERTLPFHGCLEGVETGVVEFPTVLVDGAAAGNAIHLGRFTMSYESIVNLYTGSGSGAAHFIAANGDSIFAEDVGQASPSGVPNYITIVEVFTITGGTGRYSGAEGNFTLERSLDQITGITVGVFEGTITIQFK